MIYWMWSILIGVVGGYYSVRHDAVMKAALWAMIAPAFTVIWLASRVIWGANVSFGTFFGFYWEAFNTANPHLHYAIIFCPMIFLTVRVITYLVIMARKERPEIYESRDELKMRVHDFYDWDPNKLQKR